MPKLIFNFPFHNQIFIQTKKAKKQNDQKSKRKVHICDGKIIYPKVLLCLITAKILPKSELYTGGNKRRIRASSMSFLQHILSLFVSIFLYLYNNIEELS